MKEIALYVHEGPHPDDVPDDAMTDEERAEYERVMADDLAHFLEWQGLCQCGLCRYMADHIQEYGG